MRPELQDMTPSDWMEAKIGMKASAFKQLVKIARMGEISVPSTVVADFNPRITFQSTSGDQTATYQRVKDVEALNKFNSGVKAWGQKVEAELKQSADGKFRHRASKEITSEFPRLSDSIKLNLRFDKQFKLETKSVGFSIARHGVYLHQGAGRGYGGLTRSKWTDKYGKYKTTAAESVGKMGTGNRYSVHWFNEVIKRNMDELADITAEYSLDLAINVNSIFLPQ